jgi:hypothetical protein
MTDQLRDVVVRFLAAHPEKLPLSATGLVGEPFKPHFPATDLTDVVNGCPRIRRQGDAGHLPNRSGRQPSDHPFGLMSDS